MPSKLPSSQPTAALREARLSWRSKGPSEEEAAQAAAQAAEAAAQEAAEQEVAEAIRRGGTKGVLGEGGRRRPYATHGSQRGLDPSALSIEDGRVHASGRSCAQGYGRPSARDC